jgi:hypothetical protein
MESLVHSRAKKGHCLGRKGPVAGFLKEFTENRTQEPSNMHLKKRSLVRSLLKL